MNQIAKYIFFSLILFSFIGNALAQVENTNNKPIVEVGVLSALTGFASTCGVGEQKAVRMAIDDYNSNHSSRVFLKAHYEDCGSTNKEIITSYNLLYHKQNIRIFIGPSWLDSYQALLPLVEKSDSLVISPSALVDSFQSSKKIWPRVFSTSTNYLRQVELILSYLDKNKIERVAIFTDEDLFNQTIFSYMQAYAKEKYSKISFNQYQTTSDNTDYRALISKSKLINKDQAIIYSYGLESAIYNFLKQKRELYPDVQLLATDFAISYYNQANFTPLMEALIFPTALPANANFIKSYQDIYKEPVGASSSWAYDAVKVLSNELDSGKQTPKEIEAYFKSSTFNTVSFGETKFNKFGGIDVGHFVLETIKNGKKISLVN